MNLSIAVDSRRPIPGETILPLAVRLLVLVWCAGALRCAHAQPAAAGRTEPLQRTAPSAAYDPSQTNSADRALMQGRIDDAVRLLKQLLVQRPGDGQASLLLCRSYYAEEHADDAVDACEHAVQQLPHSSEAWDWMGKAYGMKASLSGPVAGFVLARKVKDAFERSVALDPNNGAAANDLGEFYVKAPALVGGGTEKATALAAAIRSRLPQAAHRIDGLAAERDKDNRAAELAFKAAVAVANRSDAWNDLAAFYIHQGDFDMAEQALNTSLGLDKQHGPSTADAAMLLDSMRRESRVAEDAFRRYLTGNATTDAQPVISVDVALGKLLEREGEKAQARIEFDDALRLASGYLPAREALQGL